MESKITNGTGRRISKQKQQSNDNYRKLYDKFKSLRQDAAKHGINTDIFGAISKGLEVEIVTHSTTKWDKKWIVGLSAVVVLALSVVMGVLARVYEMDQEINHVLYESRCLVENNGFLIEVARPPVSCSMCKDLKSVPIEYNISTEEFVAKYAYSSIPVLIKDATSSWSAMTKFNFHYFKNLYTKVKGAFEVIEEECQFFPYSTEFQTLKDVFNMSDARANFTPGEKPWYIGWSNCHQEISAKLREHYVRPYFLPNDSESSIIDWIFMGGPGKGAFMHLDYVQRPSWQAQISGTKTWSLIPSPECESVCHPMNITVHKGDIIIIDTNTWYHATYIHPGPVSITIGSEYD